MAKKETKVTLERSYNIPIRKKTRATAKHKKTPRAIRVVRQFLQKHMKAEVVKLGPQLNLLMWKHGIKNPPHHIKVHAIKEDDVVRAELEGYEYKEAVKAEKKDKGPKTLKDKIEKKLGVDKMPDEEPETSKQKLAVPEKPSFSEKKAEEKKVADKKEVTTEEPKKEIPAEKVPTAHELAAKKQ
jgi:large subunit ribosomal protein L31e